MALMEMNAHNASQKQERFMRLLMPVYRRLEGFAFAMTRNSEDACDLVGETVLRAFEHFDRLRDEQAFLGYLFRIASRVHGVKRSRGKFFGAYDEEGAERMPYGGTAPDVSADVAMLYVALGQLPDLQREAVVLFEISGLSLKEIHDIQGGSISSVKMRLNRGRKRLAQLLGVEEPEPRPVSLPKDSRIQPQLPNDCEAYQVSFGGFTSE